MEVGEKGAATSQGLSVESSSPVIAEEHPAVRRTVFPPDRNSNNSGNAPDKKGFGVPSPGRKISDRIEYKNGNIIWAKAFAYTWWPGRVERIQGSSVLVAFYGCDRVKWCPASKVVDFERHYARMVRMMGVKLADNIALAVQELQRRAVLGLMCRCRSSAVEVGGVKADQIKEAKMAFEVKDMMDFLLVVGCCAWIDKEEVVRAAKLSEQIIAYRKHVSICTNSKVDDAFCSEDCLKVVRSAAVSWYTGDCEIRDNLNVQVQLNVFRQFVSVHPSWIYHLIDPQEEKLIGDTYKEIHWPSPQKDLLLGVWRETDYYLQHQQDEDFEAPSEQAPVDREICIVNKVDFSVLDIDQGYMSPMDCEPEVLAGSSRAFWAGKDFESENIEMQKPSTERSINMGDNIMIHVESFHSMRDADQTEGSGTKSKIREQHMELSSYDASEYHGNAVPCLSSDGDFDQSQEQISDNAITLTSAKKHKVQLCMDASSCSVKFTSSLAPIARGLDLSQHIKCPPNEKLTSTVETQSIFEGDVISREELETRSYNVKKMSSLAYLEVTPLKGATNERSFMKKSCDHPVSGGSFKLNKSLDPCSRRFANIALDGDKVIYAKEHEIEKTIMLENVKYPKVSSADVSIVSCKISRGSHSLKSSPGMFLEGATNFFKKRRLDRPVDSDTSMWTRFYASPLVSTASVSSIKTLNSPGNGSPKTLHMKFPKDFNLPSKEELQQKFRVFGPLDHSKTRLFFYTGAAQVVFSNKADAVAAYRFVKKKNIFGPANVRFWFDDNEKSGSAYIGKTNCVKG